MAKYMDSDGIRALAESAKSYFAANADLESTNMIQQRTMQIISQMNEMIEYLEKVIYFMGTGDRIAFGDIYNDPSVYEIAGRMMPIAPPVPCYVSVLSCKNSSNVQYFPDAYIPVIRSLAGSFYNANALVIVGNIYAERCSSLAQTFYNATKLRIVGDIYAPQCADASFMFAGCGALERIGRLDIGTPDVAKGMFKLCPSLKTVPGIDTSAVRDFSYMFDGSHKIERIEGISFKSATDVSAIFNQMGHNVTFARLLDIGYTDVMPDLSALTKWGTGRAENLESLRYSLVESSCDRAAAGLPTLTMLLSRTSYALLSSEDVARITAKGYTIFPK